MVKLTTPLLIMALTVWAFTPAAAQNAGTKDEQFREMTALIESGRYLFTVQSVQPTGARTVHTTPGYTLEASDSIFKAYLPYYGRSYQSGFGGDGGIEFEASPENLTITVNEKKQMIQVQFEISGKNDKYDLYLSAGSSGYGSLSINSQNRQPISYSGTIGPLREE
ncbi:MAG: DUF4251 domain-containing protein [Bacteroidales bacterium]